MPLNGGRKAVCELPEILVRPQVAYFLGAKQADVLEGATILTNPNGSAPGQRLDTTFSDHRKLIMLVPGPPSECKPLFDEECLPRLRAIVPPRHIAKRTLRAAMIRMKNLPEL